MSHGSEYVIFVDIEVSYDFAKVELKLVPTGIKDQHKQLGMEALNIMEDSIHDTCTCARSLGCNSSQDWYVYLCNGLRWTFLIILFCYILCKFV